MRKNLLFLLFLFAFPALAWAQDVITLEEACDLARQHSPQVEAQRHSVEAAEAQLTQATYYWTPKLSFRSEFGPMPKVTDLKSTVDDVWDYIANSWGFTMRNYLDFWIPLFTSTKVYNTRELAKIGLKVEELRVENEILNVEYDVSRAYIGLQLAIAAGDVLQEAEDYVQRIQDGYDKLREEAEENEDGESSVKETDQYRIDIARTHLGRLRNDVAAKRNYAEHALAIHTGLSLPIRVEEMNFDRDPVVLKKAEEIQELAHQYRGDLKLLEQSVAAADLRAHIEWLNWWPDLVLGGQVYYKYSNAVPKLDPAVENFYYSDGNNAHGFTMGFILTWNVDPVRQAFRVREMNAQAERTRTQRDLAIAGIDLEVLSEYQTTANCLANIELTYQSRRAAKRILTQEMLNYEAGTGDVDAMIAALRAYIEQRSMYLQALHDFRVALVKLQKVTGVMRTSDLLE